VAHNVTSTPGPGVDRSGNSVVDPTANVVRDIKAAVQRLDDLREADRRYLEAETRHLHEIQVLQGDHARELRTAESARLDAIRAVDAAAVQRAADVAGVVATTLANQVATSAEALRTQVTATAAAQTAALTASLEPIKTDLAGVIAKQYVAQGAKAQDQEGTVDRRASAGLLVAVASVGSVLLLGSFTILLTILFRG
jgi:biotin carboxyl carrier protein